MKKIALIFSAASLLMLACNSDKKTEEGKMDSTTETKMDGKEKMEMPDSATMAKNWQDYMMVGDVQKMMATWDGTWDGEVTMWMEPGASPQVSKSQDDYEWPLSAK